MLGAVQRPSSGNAPLRRDAAGATVTLHIYDVTGHQAVDFANRVFRTLGTGAFHAAVEIYGDEWSYGWTDKDTGVFSCPPRLCEAHKYRESIAMGTAKLSQFEVGRLLEDMMREWQGADYDLLRHNCCHFSDAFCQRLGVGPIPTWITSLAAAGVTLDRGLHVAADNAHAAAIIAAAKAGEIDQKINISGRAENFIKDLDQLDKKHGITTTATQVGTEVSSFAQSVARGTLELVQDIAQEGGDHRREVAGQRPSTASSGQGKEGYQFGDFTRGLFRKLTKDPKGGYA
eukprot:gnl/TRDRNA2_/TRDRNA2_91884_c1_seq1.p1 gnl/TRDRNA2_/TRDRNA2_91884_c1~~gnl/TRDRNA2_/TRDRNA2_91884_c1_seq1.p1  ORF type:complete len:287 (+),score=41.19 gnl/TRDRNA2_/TRDRNA2_91884_c1_seq1:89-949(+)